MRLGIGAFNLVNITYNKLLRIYTHIDKYNNKVYDYIIQIYYLLTEYAHHHFTFDNKSELLKLESTLKEPYFQIL